MSHLGLVALDDVALIQNTVIPLDRSDKKSKSNNLNLEA